MSSTNVSNPSIPKETRRGATLEDAVNSLKAVNPRKAYTCRSSFSMEEILKPSFGAKTNPQTDIAQPLDMRTERKTAVNEASERDEVYMDVSTGACPFRSPSPDQNSNSSSNSRGSSPDSRNYSSSENGDSHEYGKLYQEHESQFRESRVFSQYQDAMTESEDVPRTYYNTLSHVYGLHLHSMGSQVFYHLGQIKHSSIPLSGDPCLSNNYFCSSIYANRSTNLKFLPGNNSSQLRRSTQESTVKTFQSNPGHAGDKPLAVKSGKNVARKCVHSDDGQGDSKTKVKSDKTLISEDTVGERSGSKPEDKFVWPAWVYCTRYSDRPSSGPRFRKPRTRSNNENDKRPRTAFSTQQLHRLRLEFETCPYLSETRRQNLAKDLGLNESKVKIWFQNKRAKLKKSSGNKNQLAVRLMEEGLYNHSTIVVDDLGNKSGCRHDGSGRR